MKRRKFLQLSGTAASVPVILNGMNLSAITKPLLFNSLKDFGRKLVLIKLNGGNDGLNMLIPLDQYDNLQKVRPNILIPQSKVLSITDTLGFHSRMTEMSNLFKEGGMGIVQSVGYPDQNRSHFRSMDIWETGSPAQEVWNSGWLGRYLNNRFPDFPEKYPDAEYTDPFAINMGFSVSKTCQGDAANFSMSLNDPFALTKYPESEKEESNGVRYNEELEFLHGTISQTNSYSKRIFEAAEKGGNVGDYPNTELGQQLKNVALLISGGLQTQLYVVSLGGFDTHATQVESYDSTFGKHPELLQTLSQAISAFVNDLKSQRLDEDVLGMTFSEFGRQIRGNGSLGTDHGTAAPLLFFGGCVNGKVLGDNPEIGNNVQVQEGVPMQFDFRDVYGSVLMDWFGAKEDDMKQLLHDNFKYVPILKDCREGITTSTGSLNKQEFKIKNYPNPFKSGTNIAFTLTKRETVQLRIFDALGQSIRTIMNKTLNPGSHEVFVEGWGLPAGNYHYHLLIGGVPVTGKMLKLQ